jgi:hypothetical protein
VEIHLPESTRGSQGLADKVKFEIQKDVPIPYPGMGKRKYPFADMEVGDSFLVEDKSTNAMYRTAHGFMAKHQPNWKFSVRKVNGGTQVWRVK